MGDFIDFFLQNPFLIIVLIGILTSMLGKKKQHQQHDDPNVPPKKKWQEVMRELQGEMQQGNPQQRPAPAPVRKVEQQQPAQAVEVIDETTNEANKRIAELRRLQQKYDQERLYQKAKADQLTSTISDNNSRVYREGPSFGKKQLIDGIIMSEVLGPPRAKRSLQRSRR
ncbi:hypothetical protein [Peribacillus simplex]|uniref:hypothetical protein n=1 Tax=Peribacillus simplex TaxID=1478 RepID=UPI0024C12B14|nr:hypothetical protein [Peribacillus simplex]WHY55135.1 hypothetical protein QNH43_18480 [Peribacillus simplex]